MRVPYQRFNNPEDIIHALGTISPRTVIVDVEPLVAAWNSENSSLSHGAEFFLERASATPRLSVICFSTNSRRRLTSDISSELQTVRYISSACKPLRTAYYREFPGPGVVIGDQVATDGMLAWRLNYSFIHYCPDRGIPFGPRLMRYLGHLVQPVLFE